MKKFELFMGCLGNGVTVCNKAITVNGDYKHIAHISIDGQITYYVDKNKIPPSELLKIEQVAEKDKTEYNRKIKQDEIYNNAKVAFWGGTGSDELNEVYPNGCTLAEAIQLYFDKAGIVPIWN